MAEYINREAAIHEAERLEMKGGNDNLTLVDHADVMDLLFQFTCRRCCPGGAWAVGTYVI